MRADVVPAREAASNREDESGRSLVIVPYLCAVNTGRCRSPTGKSGLERTVQATWAENGDGRKGVCGRAATI